MDVKTRTIIGKTLIAGLLAFLAYWLSLWFYVNHYHYYRAVFILKMEGIHAQDLRSPDGSWAICGKTATGWVLVYDKIFTGRIAEEECSPS